MKKKLRELEGCSHRVGLNEKGRDHLIGPIPDKGWGGPVVGIGSPVFLEE